MSGSVPEILHTKGVKLEPCPQGACSPVRKSGLQQRDHLSFQVRAQDTDLGVTCREERFPKGGNTRAQGSRLRRWRASEEKDVPAGDAGERGVREVADHARPQEPLSDFGRGGMRISLRGHLAHNHNSKGEPEGP